MRLTCHGLGLQCASLLSSDGPFPSVHILSLLTSLLTPSRSPTLVLCARSPHIFLLLRRLLPTTCTHLFQSYIRNVPQREYTGPRLLSFVRTEDLRFLTQYRWHTPPQVIDGRLHLACQHFIPMSTRKQDCLRPNCLFSRNHAHPVGEHRVLPKLSSRHCVTCKNRARTNAGSLVPALVGCREKTCSRMMQPPQRNPIRISDSKCADCVIRGDGRGVLGCS